MFVKKKKNWSLTCTIIGSGQFGQWPIINENTDYHQTT